ncbi:ABC transporter permease [Treponema ruminis]|uniref:Lipoprotein-releasing system permease protein n=1 Tax=Treponema ruminis TaxID=744515 RepID=A0A7W8LLV5_9SPIR|nr:ABC transporter permease [Treponema ruminis]MBB5225723.1 lipoprotein-releasing system permease protein [Treponema ruminis]
MSIKKGLSWIFFVSRRFAKVDRKGSSAVTTTLATLGICFGVMTLITVISVMNGFQHSFIDVIMEISSYHIRVESSADGLENGRKNEKFESFCAAEKSLRSVTPFYEAQALVLGTSGKEAAAMIKALPSSIYSDDPAFKKHVQIYAGTFDISEADDIVIGSELARRTGSRPGSKINLYALSGGNDVDLFSSDRLFTVRGIFHTGYADINASFAFINLEAGQKYFGKDAKLIYGVKLFDENEDSKMIGKIASKFPDLKSESWKSYNRSFFGALRVEKNMLMMLVFLIFVVVAINIFNGMRRMVYERREEISVLTAFGGRPSSIQSIFVMQGFLTGLTGSVLGVILGLFLSINMETVFILLSKISYYATLFAVMIVNPANGDFVRENPMFMLYASIPPKIFMNEVFMIALFGIYSSLLASFWASRAVLKMTVVEVMRDE